MPPRPWRHASPALVAQSLGVAPSISSPAANCRRPRRAPPYARWTFLEEILCRLQSHSADNLRMERGKGFFGRTQSETERRRTLARTYYDFEVECRVQGRGDPAFVYDEEHDLFRFPRQFAFSREQADRAFLKRRGRLQGARRRPVPPLRPQGRLPLLRLRSAGLADGPEAGGLTADLTAARAVIGRHAATSGGARPPNTRVA